MKLGGKERVKLRIFNRRCDGCGYKIPRGTYAVVEQPGLFTACGYSSGGFRYYHEECAIRTPPLTPEEWSSLTASLVELSTKAEAVLEGRKSRLAEQEESK